MNMKIVKGNLVIKNPVSWKQLEPIAIGYHIKNYNVALDILTLEPQKIEVI